MGVALLGAHLNTVLKVGSTLHGKRSSVKVKLTPDLGGLGKSTPRMIFFPEGGIAKMSTKSGESTGGSSGLDNSS